MTAGRGFGGLSAASVFARPACGDPARRNPHAGAASPPTRSRASTPATTSRSRPFEPRARRRAAASRDARAHGGRASRSSRCVRRSAPRSTPSCTSRAPWSGLFEGNDADSPCPKSRSETRHNTHTEHRIPRRGPEHRTAPRVLDDADPLSGRPRPRSRPWLATTARLIAGRT